MWNNYNPFIKHIFADKHGKMIYYDYRTETAYWIADSDKNRFRALSYRWSIALCVILLFSGWFVKNIWIALLLGIVTDLILAYVFYQKFLPSCVYRKERDPKRFQPYDASPVNNDAPWKRVARVFLYLAFAVLIVLNAYDQHFDTENLIAFYLCWLLAAGAVILALRAILVYLRQK